MYIGILKILSNGGREGLLPRFWEKSSDVSVAVDGVFGTCWFGEGCGSWVRCALVGVVLWEFFGYFSMVFGSRKLRLENSVFQEPVGWRPKQVLRSQLSKMSMIISRNVLFQRCFMLASVLERRDYPQYSCLRPFQSSR